MSAPEIQQIHTRVAYQNRWMTVREDQVLRRSGAEGLYGVVVKPDFAVVAAVEGQRVYLVQQYRYPVEGRYWEFPQGSAGVPGADRLAQAATELREETGLVAASWQHVGFLFEAYGHSTQGFDIYLATQLRPGPAQPEPEEEGLVAQAFDIAEVERMVLDGEIKDAATVAAFGLLRMKRLI